MTNKRQTKRNQSRKDGSYSNAIIGHGTKIDPMARNKIKAASLLNQSELNDIFIGDGLGALIIKIYPEEMTRAGFKLEGLNDKLQEKVFEYLAELDFNKKVFEALCWSRLYGGSALVFGFKDGGGFQDPLNPKSISDIEFIRVYDRHELSESKRERNPENKDFGKIIEWHINPVNGNAYKVHYTRMFLFDGEIIPNKFRNQNTDWGASALQTCYTQLINTGCSHGYALTLLQRMQQAVHGIKDLQAILDEPNGELKVMQRINAADMGRGILNTVVIDSEETYTIASQTLTGIKDVLTEFLGALAAVSGIPVFILGRSVGGLNATGEREVEAWYAKVLAEQEARLTKFYLWATSKVLTVLNRSANTKYKIKYNPLYLMDAKEQAELDKANAETDGKKLANVKAAIDSGYATREDCKQTIMDALHVTSLKFPDKVEYVENPKDEMELNKAAAKSAAKPQVAKKVAK